MKKILFVSAVLLASSFSLSNAQSAKKSVQPKKQLALQLYSLRDDITKDYSKTIDFVSKTGFTAIEAAGYSDGKFYGKTPSEFKSDMQKAGLTVLSSHTMKELSAEELVSGDFSESLKWWNQCIQAHKEAGMKYVVVPWMTVPKTLKDLKTYCKLYDEVGKRCKEAGMKFGYHNHAHEFEKVEDKVMLDYMLENTNPSYVFFQMDVYWVVRGQQSPVDYFHKYPGRFTLLHFKDNKELGQSGMVGFDAILKNTDVAGVEFIIVEVEKYSYTPFESVKISFDYLNDCPLVKKNYLRSK